MDQDHLRKRAQAMLDIGYGRQHVFDMLVAEHLEVKARKVAEVVRYTPTLIGRETYRRHHRLLLAAIVLYGLLRVLQPMLEADFAWSNSYRLVSLAPIATLLFAYSVYRWQGQVFAWVAWANLWGGFGLLNGIIALGKGNGDPWAVGLGMLSVSIGALALYLSRQVFPKYEKVKDPLSTMPPRYMFPAEPGMTPM